MKVFHSAKRHYPFHHWEPIHITTHDEPLFDERLVYEGKHDKHTQVFDQEVPKCFKCKIFSSISIFSDV